MKTVMISNALEEVWEWKKRVHEEMKDFSIEERATSFRKATEDFCKKYGLKFKTLHPAEKAVLGSDLKCRK
ncbi:MAG: hypothetical protein QME42_03545 [bacterium]|nr:hypothetical protein [bacterium]